MEYEDKVFAVLRNFMEYKEYKGESKKAVKVILKKFPDVPEEDCTILFDLCCKAYTDALELVKENHQHYSVPSPGDLKAELHFRKKYKEVPDKILTWVIGWIYHWYYER